jgi:chromosome segregation ATPase
MITGRQALSSVEQAISRLRVDEGRLDAALRSAMDEVARLRHQEADGFRGLAQIRLNAMTRDRVIDDLDATERHALAMIEEHRREIEKLAHRRDTSQAALETAETTKHDRHQELAVALEALDDQRAHTAERMKSDDAWKAGKAAVEAAEKIAAGADQKASLTEADLAAKRKPYEDDPLFMYLWNRKHGQPEDTSGFLVRFVDRKIARLVGYRDARANFAMLQEIPTRLREHADSKRNDVVAAKEDVTRLERQALVADGVEALEQRAAAAHAAMKAAEDAVVKLTAELQQIDGDRQRATGASEGAVYDRAVDLLAQTLSREDLGELYQEAVRTPTKADDAAISSISAARQTLAKADGEVAQIREEIREMARRRGELEGSRDRARTVGYDDPRGRFDGGNEIIGNVIGGILRGVVQGVVLDGVLRDNYRSPSPRADPDFGGRQADSWGGGWMGGGSRGSDDDGGGGWRTGGSF